MLFRTLKSKGCTQGDGKFWDLSFQKLRIDASSYGLSVIPITLLAQKLYT